jgi:uncharacterized Zn-finger protein
VQKLLHCDIDACGKSFTLKSNLYTHQRTIHSHERPFVCTFNISQDGSGIVCGKSFKLKYMLQRHMKIHEKTRNPNAKRQKIPNSQLIASILGVVSLPLPPSALSVSPA